jgi:hypothetical protein
MYTDYATTTAIVAALLVLTLYLARMAHQHQRKQSRKRSSLKRLADGIDHINSGLEQLSDIPLPKRLKGLMLNDVCERLEKIKLLYPAYPELARLQSEAEVRRRGLQEEEGLEMPEAPDEETARRIRDGLEHLVLYFESDGPVGGLSDEGRKRYRTQLRELRAEVLAGFHMHQARDRMAAGERLNAAAHAEYLMKALRQQGPNTEKVKTLYYQAETAYKQYSRKVSVPRRAVS